MTTSMINLVIELIKMVNEIVNFHYGQVVDFVVSKRDERYRSLDPTFFWKYHVGLCHDYANGVCWWLCQHGFQSVCNTVLANWQCTVLYTKYEFISERGNNHVNYHAMPIFKLFNRFYVVEGSWKDDRALGLHEFNSIEEIVETLEQLTDKLLLEYNLTRISAYEYWVAIPKFEGGLTREQLLAH